MMLKTLGKVGVSGVILLSVSSAFANPVIDLVNSNKAVKEQIVKVEAENQAVCLAPDIIASFPPSLLERASGIQRVGLVRVSCHTIATPLEGETTEFEQSIINIDINFAMNKDGSSTIDEDFEIDSRYSTFTDDPKYVEEDNRKLLKHLKSLK